MLVVVTDGDEVGVGSVDWFWPITTVAFGRYAVCVRR
jgi:hypothetical protein